MDLLIISEALNRIAAEDGNTSITRGFLMQLINNGELDHEMRGNRIVIDYDDLPKCLRRVFNVPDSSTLPRIRTIMRAVGELKDVYPQLHIGESRLRALVAEGVVPYVLVGNRAYISLESIDYYISHWHEINKARRQKKKDEIDQNIMSQLENVNFQRKIRFSRR